MANYDKKTGDYGTLRIIHNEDAARVTFQILCSWPTTSTGPLSWTAKVNGTTHTGTVTLPAGFGTKSVLSGVDLNPGTQTLEFSIGASGTQGLGGPTTLTKKITTATAPKAPTWSGSGVSTTGQTSQKLTYASGGNGGATIDEYQVQRSLSSSMSSPSSATTKSTSYTSTALTEDTTYYWRVRAHNSVGWGPWSTVKSAKTWKTPKPPLSRSWGTITDTSIQINYPAADLGGATLTRYEHQISKKASMASPTTITNTALSVNFTGLTPATNYYVRSRSVTNRGTSAWNNVLTKATTGGTPPPPETEGGKVWVKTSSGWVKATMLVKTSSGWIAVQPKIKTASGWIGTAS